jgi:hypothetical protein
MIAFIQDRLDEDERDTRLFHEFDCPVEYGLRGSGMVWCGCPCPQRLLRQTAIRRQIVKTCQQQIHGHPRRAPGLTINVAETRQLLTALTLPYRRHPGWRTEWRS